MKVDVSYIFKFYETRLKCHVTAVNYFASLLGHSFPDHDGDKNKEPIRTGYAYVFYNKYHPDGGLLYLKKDYAELCKDAQNEHHKHATHHVQYYSNVSQIPDVRLYEMISDWASANFEQTNILGDTQTPCLEKWFDNNMAHLPWTEHQIDIINKSFKIIREKTDKNKVISIWDELVKIV